MAVIRNSELPAFNRIQTEGATILDNQVQADLKIGLINMMPDTAIRATEWQFIRLLARCQQRVVFYPFDLAAIKRTETGQQHIDKYYFDFAEFEQAPQKLDGLIISGSNVPSGEMSAAPFWQKLCHVFNWVYKHHIPTLFTCLATHAALEFFYQQKRQRLESKCWGVFRHKRVIQDHPMTQNLAHQITVPHSRFNVITSTQFQQADIEVLVESSEVGVHLAQCRKNPFTFFQGHPEYDANSLLKEYKRELKTYVKGRRSYPPAPRNYFNYDALNLLGKFKQQLTSLPAASQAASLLDFPEDNLLHLIQNTWFDQGVQVFQNWLNQLNQMTDFTKSNV